MCSYDCTVFPANATYVRQSGVALAHILAMSPSSFCHVQLPMIQAQTSVSALVKHKRLLEDQFMRSNLNIVYNVQLLFAKPDGAGRDQRALSQQCLALVHNNFDASEAEWLRSDAVKEGKLGPVSLVKFSEFLGHDEVSRPSAQSRVEQILVPVFRVILSDVFSRVAISCSRKLFLVLGRLGVLVVCELVASPAVVQEGCGCPHSAGAGVHEGHGHQDRRSLHHLRFDPEQA